MLVMADNVRDAFDNLMKGLSDMVVDFEVISITESPLRDIFPYEAENAFEDNGTPVKTEEEEK